MQCRAALTYHTEKRRDVGPAPLHVGQRLVANHASHVVHETVGAWRGLHSVVVTLH